MELGVGLDQTLRLTLDEQRRVVREAASLGCASAWTPSGLASDAILACVEWWHAAPSLVVGPNVVPTPLWTLPTLAALAATAAEITQARFVLGVGSGRASGAHGVQLMREHLTALRERLTSPRVPLYLGALGPRMLRLAGELADGAALNWCDAASVDWSRRRIAEGAARAARDPSTVRVIEYVRVAVDDDREAARRALARALLGYLTGSPGYRAHFARMGFGATIADLDARRDRGATPDELADAIPAELLSTVGVFGSARDAAASFRRLAEGLDVGIVRVVAARPGVDAVLATIRACAR